MALERGIALAAFAVGLAVVALALFGCGKDEPPEVVEACPAAHHAHPVLGAAYRQDREVVRLVTFGQPCGYADDFYRGTLYVELRRPTDERIDYEKLVCVDAPLERRAPAGTRLSSLGQRPDPTREVEELLRDPNPCPTVSRMQASFIIN